MVFGFFPSGTPTTSSFAEKLSTGTVLTASVITNTSAFVTA